MSLFGAVADHYVAAGGGGSYSAAVLADAPIFYARLGDASGTVMTDSSGNGHNGIYSGAPTLGTPGLITGDSDTCMTLTGSNYALWGGNQSYMIVGSFTAEILMSPSVINASTLIFCRADLDFFPGGRWVWYLMQTPANKIQAAVYTNQSSSGQVISSTSLLAAGAKYHLALTYDMSTIRLYVNGSLEASGALSGIPNQPGVQVDITLGADNGGNPPNSATAGAPGSTLFHGRLDEAAFYGTALSASRIAAHAALV